MLRVNDWKDKLSKSCCDKSSLNVLLGGIVPWLVILEKSSTSMACWKKKCSSRSIQPWSDNAHSLEPFWSAYYSPSLLKRYHTAKTISERNNKWFGCRTGVLPSSWNCYTCHTWNLILRSIFQRLCLCLFQKCHQKRVWCRKKMQATPTITCLK